MSNFGKAYLAFTATDGAGGGDVRCAFYYQGQWALESAPLDNRPADPAGLGDGRPQVATAGDGTAIVVWGEDGHIYSRRVVGTSPSVVDEQADPPSAYGWAETGAGATDPAVAVGGDDSYATVAFEEELESVGVPPQTGCGDRSTTAPPPGTGRSPAAPRAPTSHRSRSPSTATAS
jgi:hypothetical protein